MKKLLMLSAVAIIAITGCKKEKTSVVPATATPQVNSEAGMLPDFKYEEKIKVYDETKNYYVEVAVRANDKSIIENGVAQMKNSKIELIAEKPVLTNVPQNLPPISGNASKKLKMTDNALFIAFLNRNIGTAAGFKLSSSNTTGALKAAGTNTVSLSPTFFVGWALTYSVLNMASTATFDDYTSTNPGGPFTLRESKLLLHGFNYYFIQGSYSYRLLDVSGTSIAYDVTIF